VGWENLAMPDLFNLLVNLGKAIWRAVNVWRKAPKEPHTVVEYVDALLFREETPSGQTRPS
jgi:hypothetical protein